MKKMDCYSNLEKEYRAETILYRVIMGFLFVCLGIVTLSTIIYTIRMLMRFA